MLKTLTPASRRPIPLWSPSPILRSHPQRAHNHSETLSPLTLTSLTVTCGGGLTTLTRPPVEASSGPPTQLRQLGQLSQQLKTPATSASCSTSHLSPIIWCNYWCQLFSQKSLQMKGRQFKGKCAILLSTTDMLVCRLIFVFTQMTISMAFLIEDFGRILGVRSWGVWVHNCRPICSRGDSLQRHSWKWQLRRHDQFTGRYTAAVAATKLRGPGGGMLSETLVSPCSDTRCQPSPPDYASPSHLIWFWWRFTSAQDLEDAHVR